MDSKNKAIMASDSSNSELLFATKTPVKAATLPTRSSEIDVSISLLNKSETKPRGSRDSIKNAKRQIFSSPLKPDIVVKLPERLKILEEFFNALVTAIRLLKLRNSLTTFANICPKIEFLTNGIFSFDHLAQMKQIYPEAIEVKRVLKYDEVTSCMKPSLHININTDSIVLDDSNCGTKYMQVRKVFHSRLVEFHKAHPKDEIPNKLLPEPLNFPEKDGYGYSDTMSVELGAPKLEVEGFDVHMEEVEQEEHVVKKVISDSTAGNKECIVSHIEPTIVGTPVKDLSTTSKELSTPMRLMSATPTLQPSRRRITMTPDGYDDSARSTNSLTRRPSRTRCLNFDDESDDTNKESDDGSVDEVNYEADDATDEDSLLQSVKAEPVKHNLAKLINMIHTLFHSTRRTVITKEELLHKLIAIQIDITDRKEVEEQLSLMLQLVPDWISETKACSGDFLVRINKMSTTETVHARLEEATSQVLSTVY